MPGNVVNILIQGKDQFSGPAGKAKRSAGGLKSGMAGLGRTVVGVGAGFIAAQASIAGVKALMSSSIGAAMAFEAQLAQIRALTGATAEDTQFLSGAIKDMARELPKSPAELGAGAYFILSSGIEDAADAVGVLEVAAKASAVGLGETEKVADALTTVLNAYGKEASEAGQVTDVMIEAVKQGKAEADAFAGVLGRVVPLASDMGISFEQVAANLATFTRLGVSAEEAATGLRSVMSSLKAPSNDAKEVLKEFGLSAKEVREQIREKGLAAVLGDLMERFSGNEEALSRLFPNIRALTSVLGTAGVGMETYASILASTEKATGNLEEGFAIVADTAQHRTQLAINRLNVELMEAGAVVLPLVARLAETAADNIALLGAAAAAAKGDFSKFNKDVEHTAFRLFELTFALPGTEKKFYESARAVEDAAEFLGLWSRAAEKTTLTAGETAHEIARMTATADAMAAEIASAEPPVDALTGAMDSLRASIQAISGAQKENIATLSDLAGTRTQEQIALEQQINSLAQEQNAAQMAEAGQTSLGGATESTTDAIDKQVGALQNLAASLVPKAIQDEVTALEHEITVLALGSAEIESQILGREQLLAVHALEAKAVEKQIDGLGDEIKALESARESIEDQIEAEKELTAQRKGTLPHTLRLKNLELEKARLMKRAEGNVESLTDAERARLDEVERGIGAERRAIEVKNLEAAVTDLQAQKSGDHLRALEAERDEVEEQIQKTAALKGEREKYIDTLRPPELLAETEALADQKGKLDDQITATTNLKAQRELYIKTLMPVELEQEIAALERQKTALANAETATKNLGGEVMSVSGIIGSQISQLQLQRERIDLVTEGWKLQGEAMLGLPTIQDVTKGFGDFQKMILMGLQAALLEALAKGDPVLVHQLITAMAQIGSIQFAQHGFIGEVSKPTALIVGEGGRKEGVQITPGGLPSGGGGGLTVNLNLYGPLLADRFAANRLVQMIAPELRRLMR